MSKSNELVNAIVRSPISLTTVPRHVVTFPGLNQFYEEDIASCQRRRRGALDLGQALSHSARQPFILRGTGEQRQDLEGAEEQANVFLGLDFRIFML